ncbi:hypothetical protein ACUY2X_04355 [Corynebacterium minutissimum]
MNSWHRHSGLGMATVIAAGLVAVPTATAQELNVESSRCLHEDCFSAFSSKADEAEEYKPSKEDEARAKEMWQEAEDARLKLEELRNSGASAEEIKAAEEEYRLASQAWGEFNMDINVKDALREENERELEQIDEKEKRLSLLAAGGVVALATATLVGLAQAAEFFLPQLKAALSL